MERWAKVKEIHQAALDRDPRQRAAFLDAACANDKALRKEVESLLAREHDAAPFLESPALDVAARSWRQADEASLVGRTISHYQVESLLGAGGMGEVYLAKDPRLDRTVALKILPADLASDSVRLHRFMREARAASALNHPNVATIHDIGESGRLRFIVMEYVEGQTLAATIDGRPMSLAMIVEVAIQVADALDAAQAKGVTHRDIKPANLMITPTGRVKVLDFGVAKTARSEEPGVSHESALGAQTTTGMIVGSLPYLSPEQCAVTRSIIEAISSASASRCTRWRRAGGRSLGRRPTTRSSGFCLPIPRV